MHFLILLLPLLQVLLLLLKLLPLPGQLLQLLVLLLLEPHPPLADLDVVLLLQTLEVGGHLLVLSPPALEVLLLPLQRPESLLQGGHLLLPECVDLLIEVAESLIPVALEVELPLLLLLLHLPQLLPQGQLLLLDHRPLQRHFLLLQENLPPRLDVLLRPLLLELLQLHLHLLQLLQLLLLLLTNSLSPLLQLHLHLLLSPLPFF